MRHDEAVTSDPELEEPCRRLIRGEPVIAKVLAATIEEIALSGLEGMTLERVAARAGVNRTTIYRRWPTKEDLVLAAFQWMAEKDPFPSDTGTLRGDLEKLIDIATAKLFAPGTLGLIRTVLGAPNESPLTEVARCEHEQRRRKILDMLERAERRGELRPDIDKELFLDGIFGMIFVRLIFKREQPTKEFKTRMLDQLMRFATPSSSGPSSSGAARPKTKAATRRTATKTGAKRKRAR
jgi:AcrR family transcriptional regulator